MILFYLVLIYVLIVNEGNILSLYFLKEVKVVGNWKENVVFKKN